MFVFSVVEECGGVEDVELTLTQVAEMDLYEAGFDTQWEDINVPSGLHGSDQWQGTRRPYWTIDVYRLPVNTFVK
jgi:protein arginine N-methyltransferase 2